MIPTNRVFLPRKNLAPEGDPMNRTLAAAAIAALAAAPTKAQIAPPDGPVSDSGRFGNPTVLNAANTPGDADSVYRITQPGSYVLTENLTVPAGEAGIEIAADNVTVDLGGFEISGPAAAIAGVAVATPTGIFATDFQGAAVRNGSIAGPETGILFSRIAPGSPFSFVERTTEASIDDVRITATTGIVATSATIRNATIEAELMGIDLFGGSIESCSLVVGADQSAPVTGIEIGEGSVTNCRVSAIGASDSAVSYGIDALRSTVRDCTVTLNAGFPDGLAIISTGIRAVSTTVNGCSVTANQNTGGIDFLEGSVITNCTVNDALFGYFSTGSGTPPTQPGLVRGCATFNVAGGSEALSPNGVFFDNTF